MPKISRNSPCPCGSGKKYRRCCHKKKAEKHVEERRLLTDVETEEQMQVAEEKETRTKKEWDAILSSKEEDGEDRKEIRGFWEDFGARDYDGKKAVFLEKLDDEEWMKGGALFDMLDSIYQQALAKKDCKGFCELLATFEKKRPKIYRQDCHFYLKWQIKTAVTENHCDIVPFLVMKLAKVAYKQIDVFNDVKDWLEYSGQLPLLVKATKAAWPKIEKSAHIIPSGIGEFAEKAAHYLIFESLETHPLNINEDELLQSINYYGDFRPDWLRKYISYITGKTKQKWTQNDFILSSRNNVDNHKGELGDGRTHLYYLSVAFLGYLRREKKASYPKGEIARGNILQYILERHAGELEHEESILEAMIRETYGRPKPKKKKRKIENILCPDCETMDRYLTRFFQFLAHRPHSAAAVFELIPQWLSFLESYRLLDQQLYQHTLKSMQKLKEDLLKILRKEPDGATLESQIRGSWDNL